MKIKILKAGRYSDFSKPGDKVQAVDLEVGAEVNYPQSYALSLIDSEMAEAVDPKELNTDVNKGRRTKSVKASDEKGLEEIGLIRRKR